MNSKEWASKQRKLRRIAQEQSESMAYYEEHKEEIELGRKAALLLAAIARMAYVSLTVEDIVAKVSGLDELNFYVRWCFNC